MWVRKRLDIGWGDLAYGCLECARPSPAPFSDADIAGDWIPPGEALICLSVRSGLDLLLTALDLPRESEVLLSAVNIPDMARIIERHGLHGLPVDIEPDTFHPAADAFRRAISPRTRVMLVAHLFGSLAEMDEIARVAEQNGILLVEDCAQAFAGRRYAGHPACGVSLFSFGPIKTATALGGAVLRIRNQALRDRMWRLQEQYSKQPTRSYFGRILKYGLLKLISNRVMYGGVLGALRLRGKDHDQFLHTRLKSFSESQDLLRGLRWRPCEPLRRLLRRRIMRYDEDQIEARQRNGRRLASHMRSLGFMPARHRSTDTYWVFPMLTHDKVGLSQWLLAHGFDIVRQSSLVAIQPPDGHHCRPQVAERLLQSLVFLPAYAEMPDREIDRLARLIGQFEPPSPASGVTPAGSAA
jgi:dTDP-4-amino-4,6-dideoxygalactose transaminase